MSRILKQGPAWQLNYEPKALYESLNVWIKPIENSF